MKQQKETGQEEEETQQEGTRLLTIREVARQMRVDETTVRRWIKGGVLEAIALPSRGKRQIYRVKQETLNALLTPSSAVRV